MNRRRSNWSDDYYNDINLGFGVRHQQRQYQRPRVQILTPRDPPIEEQKKLCTKCHGKLNWLDQQRRYICYSCGVTYNEHYDTLPSSNDQSVRPLQSVDPYDYKNIKKDFYTIHEKAELTLVGMFN